MKYVQIKKSVLILWLVIIITLLLSGCQSIVKNDMKHVINAYTAEDSIHKYYTFKAKIRSIRTPADAEYEHLKYIELEVDKEYFEQQYGNDEFVFGDGTKRWESAYSSFNHYEFQVIPSSYRLLTENGGYDLLVEGTEVIISANDYFGWNGWKYPILSLTIGDTTYLDFETGKENYLSFVRAGFKDS